MNIETRTIESADAGELYISAAPRPLPRSAAQVERLFAQIAERIRAKHARILHERVFVTHRRTQPLASIRSGAYGDLDDGVAPSWLLASPHSDGEIAGVQVHAVWGADPPQPLECNGALTGRTVRQGGAKFVALSGISSPEAGPAPAQARAMLETAESLLHRAGGDLRCVARTWMWLEDILSWYAEFNGVRNEFFTQRGLMGDGVRRSLPASTGIGVAPAAGGCCAMDLTAVIDPAGGVECFDACGNQRSACNYGSAFSRAARARSPAGRTVFVSGTASVDARGNTAHIGDSRGQIAATINNVRAVLQDLHCLDREVVEVMAYCKTPEVQAVFDGMRGQAPWPWVPLLCDICRPDLLFEIEAAAVQATWSGNA